MDFTYLLIKYGGISLSLLLRRFRPLVDVIIPLRQKSVLTSSWCSATAGKYILHLPRYPANQFRSLHTYKMPKKPIKQGYKIYGIADHGYIYNWLWSSREKGYQDTFDHPDLTPTGCLVRHLVLSLPRRFLTIYFD